ncbi:hypothetical protein VIGAN_02058200, partial [Vigna angularis var. angularis]
MYVMDCLMIIICLFVKISSPLLVCVLVVCVFFCNDHSLGCEQMKRRYLWNKRWKMVMLQLSMLRIWISTTILSLENFQWSFVFKRPTLILFWISTTILSLENFQWSFVFKRPTLIL